MNPEESYNWAWGRYMDNLRFVAKAAGIKLDGHLTRTIREADMCEELLRLMT